MSTHLLIHTPVKCSAPHPPQPKSVASDRDEVILDRALAQEPVPARFSSPELSSTRLAELTLHDQESFNRTEFPQLPEMVDDGSTDSIATSVSSKPDDETRPEVGARACDFLRCPQCDTIMKWLFVKQCKDGENRIHGCASLCECTYTQEERPNEQRFQEDGPVQVSRGAW
ncbi:hypothetical protein LTR56_010450 [Elasticomyces elasticus]|nr:hypothetical protein LTR56_010450 [Elasticomyces elasticus]KAK3648458.1 hypothetical protein LTR22_013350 [Elasticomyces elasticus]KAK4905691.1 hypothetical protein LTR49_025034 [Elasticomyces elasticus]KAK5745600.1 hypothetical protein LTS12_023036 [Elasticomyces elasticus]